MEIGDRVDGIRPQMLFCGSGLYPYAVVVSLNPFVMVSSEGDMLWSKQDIREYRTIGKATDREFKTAVGRFCLEYKFYVKVQFEAPQDQEVVCAWCNEEPAFTSYNGRPVGRKCFVDGKVC